MSKTLAQFWAKVRGTKPYNWSEDIVAEASINSRGELLVAQGLPDGVEIVRLGRSWQIRTASAFAALTAIPTTVAALSLYNNNPDGDSPWCFLIEAIFAVKIVADVTQVNQYTMWTMNNITGKTSPTDAALAIRSLSGRRAYDGKGVSAVGATVTDEGWFPAGNGPGEVSAAAGSLWTPQETKLQPIQIVPPKGMFNMHITTVGAAAGQFHCGFRFHEAQLRYAA